MERSMFKNKENGLFQDSRKFICKTILFDPTIIFLITN